MNSIYLILVIVSIISLNNANIEEKRQLFKQVSNAFNLNGKVALITGSGSGMGAETARLFSYLGGQVVITNIEPNSVKAVAEECQQLSPNKLKPLEVVADLTKEEDVKRLVEQTIKHYGKIDILANVAGILIPARINDQKYFDVFDKVIKLNLRAVLHLTNLLTPYLKQTNGTIVNVASLSAKFPAPMASAYVASKAALVQVSRTLAVELGPNIRVNSISPGYVITPMTAFLPQEVLNYMKSKVPLGRNGCPLDIAKAILFFASPLAQWITGQNLDLDGGFYGDYASALS